MSRSGEPNLNGDGVRHRQTAPNSSNASTDPSTRIEPSYTAEQVEAVAKIKRCKNYYEILGVTKQATESDLKKSYRKLALAFHPDKNHAPGATEAFKAIGNAFAVLSDSDKRRKYDLYGEEEARQPRRNHHHHDYSHGGFEADITPEELFNMFFGGSAFTYAYNNRQTRPRYTYSTAHQNRRERHTESNASLFFQLSPLLMMVLLSFLSFALQGEDPYKLMRTSNYKYERTTHNLNVKYYVQETFTKYYYGNALRKLEREIEGVYINNLRNECYREQLNRQNLQWKARYRNDGKAYEDATNMRLPHCERLQSVYG